MYVILQVLQDQHDTSHLGINKIHHMAKRMWGESVTKKDVSTVVADCHICRQVDPSPVM